MRSNGLNAATPAFLDSLAARLSDGAFRPPEPRDLTEPRGLFHGQGVAVIRPNSAAEVSVILKACNDVKIGVVPIAGGTGLVGGQVNPHAPASIILSMERMNNVRDVSGENNTMTVDAGVILADIRAKAEAIDRLFPLSLASEGSCRIGGNLATNAGGVNVLRYGNARDLCLGLEFVLADGTIVEGLKNLRKDNTGFDLRSLMIGSEGALGVITGAVLRLFPLPKHVETAFLAVPSPQAALDLLNTLNGPLSGMISAFELIHQTGLSFMDEAGIPYTNPFPNRPEWMVLVDLGAGHAIKQRVEAALADMMEAGLISNAVIAQNLTQRQSFWALRERIPEGNKAVGSISSHDISVPVGDVPAFIAQAKRLIDPGLRINCFGHLGDGNLHYNIFPPQGKTKAAYADQRQDIARSIYDLVAEFRGSFSAEHGVGRLKIDALQRYEDAGKLQIMRRIKAALDPNGIMNPGAVLN